MGLINTAIAAIFPPAGIAMNILGKGKALVSGAVDWLTRSTTHILIAAVALLALMAGWEHHKVSGLEVQHKDDVRAIDGWQSALRTTSANLDKANAAIAAQNTATDALAKAQAEKQQAAQAALSAATARAQRAEAHAAGIDRERAQRPPSAARCPSGDAVLQAKEDL